MHILYILLALIPARGTKTFRNWKRIYIYTYIYIVTYTRTVDYFRSPTTAIYEPIKQSDGALIAQG